MTGNVQLYLTDVGRVLHRMGARLAGDGGWVKGGEKRPPLLTCYEKPTYNSYLWKIPSLRRKHKSY